MTTEHDLVIRNGTIADGKGSPLVNADIAVNNGRIVAVGEIEGTGTEEIDATGLLVTPGFVDIHTHYDGQATWDSNLLPSSWHGVTTVVMGSCGVGFAPVRPSDHQALIDLMEGIEDIPGSALHEGLKWNWETFSDYLDALEQRPYAVDVCAQLPHGPLRLYVMGERAIRLEDATAADIAQMRQFAFEAAEAGATGFSTSRSLNHKSIHGDPTPTLRAREEELTGIALGFKDAGKGSLQWVSDFMDDERQHEYDMIQRIVRESGRPMSISVGQTYNQPDVWRETMNMVSQARKEGLDLLAQVAPRPIGVIMGLSASAQPFIGCPSFAPLRGEPAAAQAKAMHDPALRAALISEIQAAPLPYSLTRLFPIGESPDYGQDPSQSIQATADRAGRDPFDVLYDLLLEDDGANLLFFAAVNYFNHDFDAIREMIADPNSIVGIGDGGAHVGMISDASFATSALTIWGGPNGVGLTEIIRRQTSATAAAMGLNDRGVIAPGMKADINLIDLDKLGLERPFITYDLPSNAKRLLQRARGYVATIVSGVTTYRNGEATGALPGKLVRGPQQPATVSTAARGTSEANAAAGNSANPYP